MAADNSAEAVVISSRGYIYVLANPEFPHLLKIGKTTRTPQERAQELSATTGVPARFEVVYYVEASDCDRTERLVHRGFAEYRYTDDREFFRVSREEATRVINDSVAQMLEEEIVELTATLDTK